MVGSWLKAKGRETLSTLHRGLWELQLRRVAGVFGQAKGLQGGLQFCFFNVKKTASREKEGVQGRLCNPSIRCGPSVNSLQNDSAHFIKR